MITTPSVGIAVITHCAKHHLSQCLPPLIDSPLAPKIVVVNSTSNDGTVELAESMGVSTLVIPRSSFNHGQTREQARKFLGTDIIVMVTPDAYATSRDTLTLLLQPIIEKKASVAYAKQIPHREADFFESFPRQFNYPEKSHIRGKEDIPTYGIYSYFCSNSFAAYSNSALDEIGGFTPVLLGEDTIAVAELLKKGHKIAYVAEAKVRHSHRYTLKQEFQRNFDTGFARKNFQDLLISPTSDQKRGFNFVKTMLKELSTKKPHLLPYGIAQCTIKYIGYKLGRSFVNAPKWLIKRCSSQDYFWSSQYPEVIYFSKSNRISK